MKFAILGYGRMGHEVEKVAQNLGHTITAVFDIDQPFTVTSALNGAQVLIDFTLAATVPHNLSIAAQLGIPVVEGTTGWYEKLADVKNINGLTMLYSPNFSIGVYQFTKIVAFASRLMGSLDSYDCYLHEWHHTGKADSPSGTAKNLANVILENFPAKDKILTDTSYSAIDKKALHVTSTRVGRVPGTHEIGFDSVYDHITLRHEVHNREGLAFGAVRGAEWLAGKTGLFTMDDFMQDMNQ
ncbi:MAG TPA: dihydrodipicolinate reductase C-terminal domain-containing protein [bacterium]|nr:dihydrodipicolinate reductase C-terminal domain-containing protein [bacterium]HPN43691.1 dihydrodipicolinate reductase C-terminal domain-containing protein [bacterium]